MPQLHERSELTGSSSRQRLYETVEATLGLPAGTVSPASSPETLPTWDSLNHLNLVMAIEAEFNIALSADDVLDMRNVELIETVLRDRGIEIS